MSLFRVVKNKIGTGHKGFNVVPDPNMGVTEAASRRDFTINSMAMSASGTIYDPFNGQKDLNDCILRATSEAFGEDPLRAMRAMQFASRFSMVVEESTIETCRQMADSKYELPKERMWEEWKKWAIKGEYPSQGLWTLMSMNWLDDEIASMSHVPQDAEWHPEGDVFVHTCHVVDQAARIAKREQLDDEDRMTLLFSALCHDMGKPMTTEFIDGRYRARGHCEAGVDPARNFLDRIGCPGDISRAVLKLIKEHLVHAGNEPTERAVRRLATRLSPTPISLLSLLVEADHSGRPPLPKGNPFKEWEAMAEELQVREEEPKPILMGRHLIDLGMTPGREMGVVLDEAFEAQLDGAFSSLDEAIEWLEAKEK